MSEKQYNTARRCGYELYFFEQGIVRVCFRESHLLLGIAVGLAFVVLHRADFLATSSYNLSYISDFAA